ncbi:AT-rich interactive domain-containing protein 3A [Hippocampus comes]|uniref:AT-rich interactive domain-containing protein 3A n=1 Tax=Hippocampus comes TaxID=109280 RepID=UPI00094EF940|nr:PREDICTED: AT-rich interactive domain-containing protein 3A-like [Hippocampus comes]
MRLEAVMENLQRQQAARLALDEKLRQAGKERDLRSMVESQIHQQALAFRHYQATMYSALAAGVYSSSPGASVSQTQVCEAGEDRNSSRNRSDNRDIGDLQEDAEEQELIDGDVEDCLKHDENRERLLQETCLLEKSAAVHVMNRAPGALAQKCRPESPPRPPQPQHHEWTYEEQFKQLYELDDDGKRKEFLDDLFSFMQKRGTPVNRIPIMAKQVLDLYTLYKLVTEKGGLVEVINKKIWREITKGLKLPTSITSAAFTLRTQYMKYLYSYECEKRGLSSPGELQAAIDSNRREGRRQSYGSPIFNYSPVSNPTLLSLPRVELSHLPISTKSQLPVFKKEDSMVASSLSSRVVLPLSPSDHYITSVTTEAATVAQPMAVTQVVAAIQASTLEQRRDKLESSEPPEKKMMGEEEQQRVIQQTSKHDMLASTTQLPLSIKFNNSRGVLFARHSYQGS